MRPGKRDRIYPLIIGGERIMTDENRSPNAPSTKEVLGRVSSCDQLLADKAIRTAHDAFQTWSKTPVEERICCVRRLVDLMKKYRYLLDAWSIEESGKNWGEADGELCEAPDFFNSYIMHMRELDQGSELVYTEESCKCICRSRLVWSCRSAVELSSLLTGWHGSFCGYHREHHRL
ncbi:MAG: aldehyde dehydrogenase family protein [Sellimonas intestinalis]